MTPDELAAERQAFIERRNARLAMIPTTEPEPPRRLRARKDFARERETRDCSACGDSFVVSHGKQRLCLTCRADRASDPHWKERKRR